MADETLLELTGIGVPPYSARGLTQTLEPIAAAGSQRRTVNGTLINLSRPEFRKFKSTISCNDQQAPALDGIWQGQVVTVKCVAELSYPTGGSASRPVVSGSSRTENGFVFYRPQLTMQVIGYSTSRDEYGAITNWSLELEEV